MIDPNFELTHDNMRDLTNHIFEQLSKSLGEEDFQQKLIVVANFNTNLISMLLMSGAPDAESALEGLDAYRKDVAQHIMSNFENVQSTVKSASN